MNLILTVNPPRVNSWSCCRYWSPFQRDILPGPVNVLKQRKHWYNGNIHNKAFIYSTVLIDSLLWSGTVLGTESIATK